MCVPTNVPVYTLIQMYPYYLHTNTPTPDHTNPPTPDHTNVPQHVHTPTPTVCVHYQMYPHATIVITLYVLNVDESNLN